MNISFGSNEFLLSGKDLFALLKDVQNKGGSLRFTAKGYSMKPAIRHNDVIQVSPIPDQGIKIGDIILYRNNSDSQIVVHRVLRIKNERFLLRGDNAVEDDGWIETEKIHGVVTDVKRDGSSVRFSFTSGNSFFARLRSNVYQFYLILRRRAAGTLFWLRKKTK